MVHGVVDRVIDGDTIVANLDLGWNIWYMNEHIRVAGINAPELSTPEGIAARDWAVLIMPVGLPITVHSHKLDKYGRALCSITLPGDVDYGTLAISSGHAVVMKEVHSEPEA